MCDVVFGSIVGKKMFSDIYLWKKFEKKKILYCGLLERKKQSSV